MRSGPGARANSSSRKTQGPSPAMSDVRDELDPPFEVIEPAARRGPVLFNSPHSGATYPRAFLVNSRLDMAAMRRSAGFARVAADMQTLARRIGDIPLEALRPYRAAAE